jgi:excisionase family DNA binding protein
MKLHTIQETSELLSWSQLSLRKLITAGKLKTIRLGRSVRIPSSEITRLSTKGAV